MDCGVSELKPLSDAPSGSPAEDGATGTSYIPTGRLVGMFNSASGLQTRFGVFATLCDSLLLSGRDPETC